MLVKSAIQRLIAVVVLLAHAQSALAGAHYWQRMIHQDPTLLAKDLYFWQLAGFAICIAIIVVVFGILIYSLIRHAPEQDNPPTLEHYNPRWELVWSIIPLLILIGLAAPAAQVLTRTAHSHPTVKAQGQ